MADQPKTEESDQRVSDARRTFLAQAGKIATVAPAAALLLAATAAKASVGSGLK